MEKREYSWQSPVDCPCCRRPLLIKKVFWFTPYDYYYLFECKQCSEERSGRVKTLYGYVPFWEEPKEEEKKTAAYKVAKRVKEGE